MNSFTGNVLRRLKAAFDKGDLETARLEQVSDRVHYRTATLCMWNFCPQSRSSILDIIISNHHHRSASLSGASASSGGPITQVAPSTGRTQ